MSWRTPNALNLVIAFGLNVTVAAAQEPTLATVLQRSGVYVEEFHRQLSGIVAEEHYVQDALAFQKRGGCPAHGTYQSTLNCQGQLVNPMRTDLKSDLLLVRLADRKQWVEFRDVFEADGVPVRDRAERLTNCFWATIPSPLASGSTRSFTRAPASTSGTFSGISTRRYLVCRCSSRRINRGSNSRARASAHRTHSAGRAPRPARFAHRRRCGWSSTGRRRPLRLFRATIAEIFRCADASGSSPRRDAF